MEQDDTDGAALATLSKLFGVRPAAAETPPEKPVKVKRERTPDYLAPLLADDNDPSPETPAGFRRVSFLAKAKKKNPERGAQSPSGLVAPGARVEGK